MWIFCNFLWQCFHCIEKLSYFCNRSQELMKSHQSCSCRWIICLVTLAVASHLWSGGEQSSNITRLTWAQWVYCCQMETHGTAIGSFLEMELGFPLSLDYLPWHLSTMPSDLRSDKVLPPWCQRNLGVENCWCLQMAPTVLTSSQTSWSCSVESREEGISGERWQVFVCVLKGANCFIAVTWIVSFQVIRMRICRDIRQWRNLRWVRVKGLLK